MTNKVARHPRAGSWALAPRRSQEGQAVTAVVILAFGIIAAVFVMGVIPLGQATDEASQAENAADAAVLAGATAIRDRLLDELTNLRFDTRSGLLGGLTCGLGRGAAEDYAARNEAAVTSYCYYPARDRVEVSVRMLASSVGQGRTATAAAAASLGLTPTTCSFDDDPLPPPPSPPPPPPGLPPLPPVAGPLYPLGTSLRCGSVSLRFDIDPSVGLLQLRSPGLLEGLLEPRLIP